MTLTENTTNNMTPKIYSSLRDFETQTFKISMLLIVHCKDQLTVICQMVRMQALAQQQRKRLHRQQPLTSCSWQSIHTHQSRHNRNHRNHPLESSQNPRVSANVDLQNPLRKLHKVLYLDLHILDFCTTLEDLLQSGQLHIYCQIDHHFTSCWPIFLP